jgi:uncharacterized protein
MDDLIVKKISEEEIERRGIRSWPIWEKEISKFPWQYDGDEECLIIDGEVIVDTDEGTFPIKAGDFVIFRKGLKCVWDIKVPIRKYYNFPQ